MLNGNSIEKMKLNHPWIICTLHYFFFIIAAIIIASVYTTFINPNATDVNSARYLLSAIVQSEAAIIAIVITLTLVAVQLTASSYTPRVADIFTKSPHMYIILGFFIFAIAYSAIFLQFLNGADGIVPSSVEFWISFAYWLMVFLCIALIFYMYNVLELLKPENIIRGLVESVKTDTILQKNQKNANLNSIFDIIHQSIMKYDTTTVRDGLDLLTARIIGAISEQNTPDEQSEIVKKYCAHLERCTRQAIDLHDEEILGIILDQFEQLGNDCAKKGLDNPTWQIITIIVEIEKLIAVNDIPASLSRILEIIGPIGKISIEKKFQDTPWRIMFCHENIAKHALEKVNPLDTFSIYTAIVENTIDSLSEYITSGISLKEINIIDGSLSYIKSIGEYSFKLDNPSPLYYIFEKISPLWKSALNNGLADVVFLDVAYFAYHVKKHTLKKYSYEGFLFERFIIEIGILAMEKSTEPDQNGIAIFLANMRHLDDTNYQTVIPSFEQSLNEIQKGYYKKFLALQEEQYQKLLRDRKMD